MAKRCRTVEMVNLDGQSYCTSFIRLHTYLVPVFRTFTSSLGHCLLEDTPWSVLEPSEVSFSEQWLAFDGVATVGSDDGQGGVVGPTQVRAIDSVEHFVPETLGHFSCLTLSLLCQRTLGWPVNRWCWFVDVVACSLSAENGIKSWNLSSVDPGFS